MTPGQITHRQRELLNWYDRRGRDLPWRRQSSVYGTWISEIMLQQTTVATVIPRWRRFLARFPDVEALAAASEASVLAEWSGLGYYRRARLLHQAARQVVEVLDGSFPETLDGWRALPGVGEYTAGAIASIAQDLPVSAVDANVRRVLTRWACEDEAAAAFLTPARIRALADLHVPTAKAGDWNQALMDLGAGPCKARLADCTACPVRRHCAAGMAGTADLVPPAVARPETREVLVGQLVLRRAGSVLLLPGSDAMVTRVAGLGRPYRSNLEGVLEGLLGLPSTPWYHDPPEDKKSSVLAAWRSWLRKCGWPRPELVLLGDRRHTITVHRMRLVVAEAHWPGDLSTSRLGDGRWVNWPTSDIPISTMVRRCLSKG